MPVRPLSDRSARQDVAILGLGNTMPLAAEITSALAENDEEHAAITATLVDALQYSTMDAELLAMLADGHRWLLRWKMAS